MRKTTAWLLIPMLLVALPVAAGEMPSAYNDPVPGNVPDTPWWENFHNPELTEFIERGLRNSPDVGAARGRIEQADATYWATMAPVFPHLSFDLSGRLADTDALTLNSSSSASRTAATQQSAQQTSSPSLPSTYKTGSAMLNAQMQVDIFGKQILATVASHRDAQAALASAQDGSSVLAGQIASAYFDAVAGKNRLDAINTQIEANKTLLELVELRYKAGDATGLDVLQQRQQLATTQTLLPQARALLEASLQQLAVLMGESPTNPPTIQFAALPTLPPSPATGVPADLASNLPALHAAKLQADSARLYKTSSIMSFFPTLSISGQYGEQGIDIYKWNSKQTWEVSGLLSIPLFQGGANLANYRKAAAGQKIARNNLRREQLLAVQQVESARLNERQYRDQLEAFRNQLDAASIAFDQSRSRYLAGLTDYQSVLTALSAQQQAELSAIQAHRNLVGARISLHQALGGAWSRSPLFSTEEFEE